MRDPISSVVNWAINHYPIASSIVLGLLLYFVLRLGVEKVGKDDNQKKILKTISALISIIFIINLAYLTKNNNITFRTINYFFGFVLSGALTFLIFWIIKANLAQQTQQSPSLNKPHNILTGFLFFFGGVMLFLTFYFLDLFLGCMIHGSVGCSKGLTGLPRDLGLTIVYPTTYLHYTYSLEKDNKQSTASEKINEKNNGYNSNIRPNLEQKENQQVNSNINYIKIKYKDLYLNCGESILLEEENLPSNINLNINGKYKAFSVENIGNCNYQTGNSVEPIECTAKKGIVHITDSCKIYIYAVNPTQTNCIVANDPTGKETLNIIKQYC